MIRQGSIFELSSIFRISHIPKAFWYENLLLPYQIIVYLLRGRIHVDLNDCVRGVLFLRKNHIDLICVAKEFQGIGVGRGLMQYAENRIKRDYDSVQLKAFKPNIPFFQKLGYEYGRGDYIKMQKWIEK